MSINEQVHTMAAHPPYRIRRRTLGEFFIFEIINTTTGRVATERRGPCLEETRNIARLVCSKMNFDKTGISGLSPEVRA